MKYPNVLIINDESIYKKNATGITSRSLFKVWPLESIKEFHIWNPSDEEREGMNVEANLIPPETFPLNMFLRKVTNGSVNGESSGISFGSLTESKRPNATYSIKAYLKYIAETRFINIHPIVDILKAHFFLPDVIYTMGASFRTMELVCKLARYYNVKTCLHYMDNWRETAFANTWSVLNLNKKINRSAEKVEKNSKCSLVISPMMEEAYSKFGKTKYRVLMNSVEMTSKRSDFCEKDYTQLTYAGGLHLKRVNSLKMVESCLSEINNPDLKLVIYTSNQNRELYQPIFDDKWTEFRDFLPHDQVYMIYEESDILIHVESFEQEQINYTKYSLSTKIPEYMSSGKPILCVAPKEISVFQYIMKNNAGISVDTYHELIRAVTQLTSNVELRKELGGKGIMCVKNNHIIKHSRQVLFMAVKDNLQEGKRV